MIENEPTDEHPRPDEPENQGREPATEAGRPRPTDQVPGYPRPQAVPDPPPRQYAPAPPPPPPPAPPAYAPPTPPQAYQYPVPYQQPAPVAPPAPETVQGGGGTLWLRPDSGVHQAITAPAPPGSYIGAPVAQPPNPYPGYPVPVYGPVEPSNGKAVAAMVLGIVGLIMLLSGLGILFFINLPCSILAWIFGVQGKRTVDRGETTKGDAMAKAGFWTGLIGTILGVLAIVIWIVAIAASA